MVFRDGQPVRLTRKVVETLLVLVENGGQVLTKDEILKAVWPDRDVDEANLTQNIAVIRRTFGVSSGDPAHIETFPGRGYRLEGPVRTLPPSHVMEPAAEPLPAARPATATAKSQRPSWHGIASAISLISICGAGWAYWDRLNVKPAEQIRVTPITRLPGKEYQPALSADGKRLAFLWIREGKGPPAVWVQNIGEANPRQITREPGHYSSPSWSPDGSQLACVRIGREASEVMIFDVGTGTGRVVVRMTPPDYGFDHRLLDWSPDGQMLVVSHSDGANDPLRLRRIRLPEGVLESPITNTASGQPGDVDPRFSPDGKTVTFLRLFHRASSELMAVRPGSAEIQITREEKHISGHLWEGENSLILGSNRSGEFLLWRMLLGPSMEMKGMKALGVYGEFPIQVAASPGSPGQLVYSVLHQDRNIWRLDLASQRWTRVIASTAQDASPQYSPDGEWVCFRSDRSGEEQLWLSRPDGSEAFPLTPRGIRPSVGHWSPDGRRIVFNNPHTGEMHLAEHTAGATWKVTPLGLTGIHPVFSPDGAFIYAGQGNEILRFPSEGGKGTPVVRSKGLSMGVSPDGKLLFFFREPNDTVLWKASIETGEVSKVVDGVVPGCTSCWAVNGAGVYYLGSATHSFDSQILYFHDFRTGKTKEVTPYPEPLWPLGSGPFSLSPDGKSLLTVRVDPTESDVQLVRLTH
ncbi:MAG: PD40 domain-containing protein [Acidobacteria bacterium]|nr:PD40 domain-containing protein [Acidobacteriota bacterium]